LGMRRDHRKQRAHPCHRYERHIARAEGRRICAEELEAWYSQGQQTAPDMINWCFASGTMDFLLDDGDRRYWIDEDPLVDEGCDWDYVEEDRIRDEINFVDKLGDALWLDHERGRRHDDIHW